MPRITKKPSKLLTQHNYYGPKSNYYELSAEQYPQTQVRTVMTQ